MDGNHVITKRSLIVERVFTQGAPVFLAISMLAHHVFLQIVLPLEHKRTRLASERPAGVQGTNVIAQVASRTEHLRAELAVHPTI